MSKKFIHIFFSILATVLAVMGCTQERIYSYTVRAASPAQYDMTFDFSANYLLGPDGQPMLYFALPGGGDDTGFGSGAQATVLSERNPLPTGIHLRWFSVTENQFWEVEHLFDASVLNAFMRHRVVDVVERSEEDFSEYFNFVVNTVPGGKAYVWISAGAPRVLIAEIQAKKVDEPDWDAFRNRSTFFKKENREEFIEKIYNLSPEKQIAQQEIADGTYPWHGETWTRLTKRYPWTLVGNSRFKVTNYLAWYVNGEQYFTYEGVTPLVPSGHAVPYRFIIYTEGVWRDETESRVHRFDIWLDPEKAVQAFETFYEKVENAPVEMQLVIEPEQKEIFLLLKSGNDRMELPITEARKEKPYRR